MKSKIVTCYYMDCVGYPYQGTQDVRKARYLGSLKSHCRGIELPVVCYTHERNYKELSNLKRDYGLENLEIKVSELDQMKLHARIHEVREEHFDPKLDGRGPEIMWGKCDIVEKELPGYDRVYWVDVGLQHPGLFPWRYSASYPNFEDHDYTKPDLRSKNWSYELDTFDFTSFFNTKIFKKLDEINKDKMTFITSANPTQNFAGIAGEVVDRAIVSPYPVGGLFGGDVTVLQTFCDHFWYFSNKILDKKFFCTEEPILKLVYDVMNPDQIVDLNFFSWFHGHDYNQIKFHFSEWDEATSDFGKPFYVLFKELIEQ